MKIIRFKKHLATSGYALLCLIATDSVIAAEEELLVTEEALCSIQPASIIKSDTFSTDGNTHLQSDNVEYSENNISRFEGNVIIQQQEQRIETEQAIYNKQTENVDAKDGVNFISPQLKVTGESAHFNLKSDQAIIKKAKYQSINSRANGEAEKIDIIDSDITELTDATYTTCDANQADWLLSASSITLNQETRQGHASHVVLRFKDIPFFYFPYLRFPLGEDRLSGFLFPYFGSSDKNGGELKVPYYWNIHPQVDATITPWYMSKRGTLLNTELRYLTQNNNGRLEIENLEDDKIVKADRNRLHWQHQSQPNLGWQAQAEYNYVDDNQHLIDFSDDLKSTSATYLTRRGSAQYNQENWLLNINAEDHQILSGANPYKRVPQVTLNSRYAQKDNSFNYAIQSEAVRFEHEDNKVIGDRLHLNTNISYPLRAAAGFLVPKVSIRHTSYNLQQATGESELSSTVPTFSLNSGLFFERDSEVFDTQFIQTLEPQLFYVYTPYKDQSALPVFDTAAYNFSVNNSFTDYRFSGKDRVGDDNRMTAALATRFINQENGKEVFMARAGQVYYFNDRKVQLPGQAINTLPHSNIIAEVKAQTNNWQLSSQAEWNPELKRNISTSSQLGFNYKKFNFDLAHRYQLNSLETREMKFNWELNSRWKFNASQLYDIKNEHVIENLYGINFESCCWGLALSAKDRYLTSTTNDRGIYLELILKGLGGFGIQQ